MLTEKNAAEALLDKRLRVNIPAPWFLRLIGIRMIPVYFKRPACAQLLRMSALYVEMAVDLRELDKGEVLTLFSELSRNGIRASRIIALGLIRSAIGSAFFHRPLAWYLRNHMDVQSLAELTKLIVFLSGGENFPSIIRSVAYMRITIPNLSQKKKTES